MLKNDFLKFTFSIKTISDEASANNKLKIQICSHPMSKEKSYFMSLKRCNHFSYVDSTKEIGRHFCIKCSSTSTALKISEKAASVQGKTLKDLQKSWTTTAQHHFKNYNQGLLTLLYWHDSCMISEKLLKTELFPNFITNTDPLVTRKSIHDACSC